MENTKPILTIRFATKEDSENVTNFRVAQFKTSKEFELLNPSLLSKQSGKVLIAEIDSQIVSTMQFEKCNDEVELNSRITNFLPNNFVNIPCYVLSKGATINNLRNTGINSYLRLLVLEKAINEEVTALVGTSYENSPRLQLLKDLGYNFYEVEEKPNDYIKPFGKVFFFSLEKNKFNFAYEKLISETKPLRTDFNINNLIKNL